MKKLLVLTVVLAIATVCVGCKSVSPIYGGAMVGSYGYRAGIVASALGETPEDSGIDGDMLDVTSFHWTVFGLPMDFAVKFGQDLEKCWFEWRAVQGGKI